jgi:hypothetical protein
MATGTVIITAGAEAAVTITDGTAVADITGGGTGKAPLHLPSPETLTAATSTGRALPARPVRLLLKTDSRQPRSISTAIRIRSEWFLAPSFCLSSEVVLATVL